MDEMWLPTFEWDGDDYTSWEVYEGTIRNNVTGETYHIEDLDDAIAICAMLNDGLKHWKRLQEIELGS